jgi:hypothetical protein
MVTTATFQLNELYDQGVHVESAQADTELTQVVSDAIQSSGVDVFALTMTVLANNDSTVHWEVAVTIPTAQIGALAARHAAPAFVASIIYNANELGNTHVNSLYETSDGVAWKNTRECRLSAGNSTTSAARVLANMCLAEGGLL